MTVHEACTRLATPVSTISMMQVSSKSDVRLARYAGGKYRPSAEDVKPIEQVTCPHEAVTPNTDAKEPRCVETCKLEELN